MSEKFIAAIKTHINYWHRLDIPEREKMEGLAFSILVMLDGLSGAFNGDMEKLLKENACLHELFYEKECDE